MIASMFNLDHRLTELRGTGDGLHAARTVRLSRPASWAGAIAALRSLLGRQPVAGRTAGVAA